MRTTALITLVLAGGAFAQSGFELERVGPLPGSRDSLALDTGDGHEAHTLRLALTEHYEHRPLLLVVDGARFGVITSRLTTHLTAAFTVTELFEASLAVPIVWQTGDDVPGQARVPSVALGAMALGARLLPLRQAHEQAPVDLAVAVSLTLPVGSLEAFTRDAGPGFSLSARVGVGHRFEWLRLGAELGVVARAEASVSAPGSASTQTLGSLVTFGATLTSTNSGPRAEVMTRATLPFTRTPSSLEVLAGGRWRFTQTFELYLLAGPGVGHTPGTPAFRALAGLAWVPQVQAEDRSDSERSGGGLARNEPEPTDVQAEDRSDSERSGGGLARNEPEPTDVQAEDRSDSERSGGGLARNEPEPTDVQAEDRSDSERSGGGLARNEPEPTDVQAEDRSDSERSGGGLARNEPEPTDVQVEHRSDSERSGGGLARNEPEPTEP